MDYLPPSSSSEEEETCLFAMKLATATVLLAALRSAIELDVLELIKKAGGRAFVSAAELAAQIPNTNPDAPFMLDRILRLLASNKILNCRLKDLPDGGVDRVYSLTPVCKFLTRNDDGVSLAPLLLMNQDKILMETWYYLKDTVVEGGISFNRAHGMSAFEYMGTDPRFNRVFNRAMFEQSTMFMKKILETYKGFEGIESLVDVGGGIGASINMIVSKYPLIKGINFDMPHVIPHAPSHPGVEHINGDMFINVPKGDAIFMKWICHDWSDEQCLKLLKNCHEALPDTGKVIIAERLLLETPNNINDEISLLSSIGFTVDLIMLAYNPGGKERTELEFRSLAKQSGFKHFRKVCCAFSISIIELLK